jgi:hypothetical protein
VRDATPRVELKLQLSCLANSGHVLHRGLDEPRFWAVRLRHRLAQIDVVGRILVCVELLETRAQAARSGTRHDHAAGRVQSENRARRRAGEAILSPVELDVA